MYNVLLVHVYYKVYSPYTYSLSCNAHTHDENIIHWNLIHQNLIH